MELKRIITKFTYRIEPKPEGGFIAHASDPSLPPLEAPTRLELQQKIQANISAALAAEFPGLKLPAENQELKFNFHIEAKPGGGFIIHSHDPGAPRNQRVWRASLTPPTTSCSNTGRALRVQTKCTKYKEEAWRLRCEPHHS